jgi:hypothetical protein
MNEIIFWNVNRCGYYWYEEYRGFGEIHIHHYMLHFTRQCIQNSTEIIIILHLSKHDSQKKIRDEYRRLAFK